MQDADRRVSSMASSGYKRIAPTVDRFLGYAPPFIHKVDVCIDVLYGEIELRITAVRNFVNSAGSKTSAFKDAAYIAMEARTAALRDAISSSGVMVQNKIGDSVAQCRRTSLAIVDTLDTLIDRYLPEPEGKDALLKAHYASNAEALIPRMLYAPFKIPVRMIHVSISKARNGPDVIRIRIKWARQLTQDQKAKLHAFIVSRSQAVTEKISTSTLAMKLQQRKQNTLKLLQAFSQSVDDGKKVVRVKYYIVCEQIRFNKTKDWLQKTACIVRQATMDQTSEVFVAVSRHIYNVTSFVAGKDRAKDIFTFVGKRLQFVKNASQIETPTEGRSSSSSSLELMRQEESDSHEVTPRSDRSVMWESGELPLLQEVDGIEIAKPQPRKNSGVLTTEMLAQWRL